MSTEFNYIAIGHRLFFLGLVYNVYSEICNFSIFKHIRKIIKVKSILKKRYVIVTFSLTCKFIVKVSSASEYFPMSSSLHQEF